MPDQFEDVDLARHSFDVGYVDDLLFFEDFDCYFFSRGDVNG